MLGSDVLIISSSKGHFAWINAVSINCRLVSELFSVFEPKQFILLKSRANERKLHFQNQVFQSIISIFFQKSRRLLEHICRKTLRRFQ